MNANLRRTTSLGLAVAMVATLAGCATTDDRYASPGHAGSLHDTEYMKVVEQMAKPRGVKVVWVNPPERRVPADE